MLVKSIVLLLFTDRDKFSPHEMGDLVPLVFKLNRQAPDSLLFVKEHKSRDGSTNLPLDRTLFVLNIPPCVDEDSVKQLFAFCGSIENVYLNIKPTAGTDERESNLIKDFKCSDGFKFAYIVFQNPSGLKKALHRNANSDKPVLFGEENSVPLLTCLFNKSRNAQIVDPENLKKKINDFMAEYDEKVELEKQKAKEMDGVPDEEGWITVTKHGKTPVTPRTDSTNVKLIAKQKKKSKNVLVNFYASQIKESKLEKLESFKKEYQEQREKIEKMKLRRKFKPY